MNKTRVEALKKASIKYTEAGLQVIPNHPKRKFPLGIDNWQKKSFTTEEINQRIESGWGIGVRNVEGLDFDNVGSPGAEELYHNWLNLIYGMGANKEVVNSLVVEKTPSGGFHVMWKCEEIDGNQKLATRPPTEQELIDNPKATSMTLIETRGLGGQFMVTPSAGYELINGHLYTLPVISIDDRELFLSAARALCLGRLETKAQIKRDSDYSTDGNGTRPGDVYNQTKAGESLAMILEAGWVIHHERGDVKYLTRPGKDKRKGISATYGYIGDDVFYPFSSNASPFEPNTAYSPFAVLTALEHGGNYSEAAKRLVVDLGLNGSNGMLSEWDTFTPSDIVQDQEQQTTFTPMSLKDLVSMPPKDWLVEGIFGAKDIGVIFGDGGSGKTFITIDMIFSVLLCKPFAGKFDTNRPLSVAYATDEGIGSLGERFAAMASQYGVDIEQDINFYAFSDVPQLFDDSSEFSAKHFVEDMYTHGIPHIDVLIIDTFMNAMIGGDDNKNSDVNIAIAHVKKLRDTLGATVILNHHTTKANGDYRGASALKGHSDFMIKVEVHGDDASKVECYKAKHAMPFKPMVASRVLTNNSFTPVLEWSEYEGNGPTVKDLIHKIIIQSDGAKYPMKSWYEIVSKQLPADKQTTEKYFERKIKELVNSGLVFESAMDEARPISRVNPKVYYV